MSEKISRESLLARLEGIQGKVDALDARQAEIVKATQPVKQTEPVEDLTPDANTEADPTLVPPTEIPEEEPVVPSPEHGEAEPGIETPTEPDTVEATEPTEGSENPEEVAGVEKELEKLPAEDKEKLGWGLNVLGHRWESRKNKILAGAFSFVGRNEDERGGAPVKSSVKRFTLALQKGFENKAKEAEEKAYTAQKEGKGKVRSVAKIAADIVRYGRVVADFTGYAAAVPTKYLMFSAMAVGKVSEAGKEARLANEDVLKKVRIDKGEYANAEELNDAIALAQEEAFRMNPNAEKATKEGGEDESDKLTMQELKNSYLKALPAELKSRLVNPKNVKDFVQAQAGKTILSYVEKLEKGLEKINNSGLSPEQIKAAEAVLLKKFEARLSDYDRMITSAGVVDEFAYNLQMTERGANLAVQALTLETLLVSADKLAEKFFDVKFGIADLENNIIGSIKDKVESAWGVANSPEGVPSPAPQTPGNSTAPEANAVRGAAPRPGAPVTIEPSKTPEVKNLFTDKEVKFEKGKGGIQAVKELRAQIRDAYKGDYSTAPKGIQEFMSGDMATKKAIELGLYNPANPEESALIQEGAVLRFDKEGNLIFGKGNSLDNLSSSEKYSGPMFDSDKSGVSATPTEATPTQNSDPETNIFAENQKKVESIPGQQAKGLELYDKPQFGDKRTIEEIAREKVLRGYEQASTTPDANINGSPLLTESEIGTLPRNWGPLGKEHASKFLKMKADPINGPLTELSQLIKNLAKLSDEKPKGRGFLWIGKPETAQEFLVRTIKIVSAKAGRELTPADLIELSRAKLK